MILAAPRERTRGRTGCAVRTPLPKTEDHSLTHLQDKTALITGGGRGISRAIACRLAQHGARVAVAARSEAELVETTRAIVAAGGRAHPIVADLAAPGAGTTLARRRVGELGRVDILVNNSGVVAPLGAGTGLDPLAFAPPSRPMSRTSPS